ncbi:hypothetical protein NFI96_020104 [Prochilodus magdalenae]|nr:hypothetical protein NFI96_020104 [Prochilodus magdalenae]
MSVRAFFRNVMGGASEHCSVPLCSVSSRYNSVVSFHSFPEEETLRKKWLVKIRRENFTVTKHTKVCSTHFTESDFVVGTSRRRLKKGSVPTVFEWNRHTQTNPRLGVWERRERPSNVTSLDDSSAAELLDVSLQHHDYDATPEPGAVDLLIMKNKELEEELQQLKAKLEDLSVKQRFGLQRFFGSDDDIRFYTRFFIHRTTVSRIIITWANFLYTLLGSVCIWMPPEVIKAHLPKEFSRKYQSNRACLLSNYQNGPLVKKWASVGGKGYLQRAVVSSMSHPVSAAPSADGCTTQDYMHTDRYHDCP